MKKTVAIILILTALITLCTSCAQKNPFDTVATTTPTEPQENPPKDDPAVDTTDYAAEAKAILQTAKDAQTPAEDFVTEVTADGVRILSYKGDAKQVCVPPTIDGNPVVSICENAFSTNETIEVLILPNSIRALQKDCLSGMKTLVALYTPFIGATAEEKGYLGYLFGAEDHFAHGKHVPATLRHVQVGGASGALADYAFAECNDVVCVLLDENIKKIGDFSFFNCTKLKFVNLDSLTEIGSLALGNCKDLVRADFGETLTRAGLGVLQGCAALSSVTLPFVGGSLEQNNYLGYLFGAEHPDFTAGYIPAYLRTVKLLDTCTVLGDYAFFECSVIKSLTLPQTLTSIGVRAFEKCTSLKSLSLPATLKTIRENAFFGCSALEEITFSEGLVSLGTNAFYGCRALREIKLPQSLVSLPASVFSDCVALESVDFGGVKTVGKQAFRNCAALKAAVGENITLEEGNDAVSALLNPTE